MKIYNTLTKRKEEFVPLTEGKVKMYVCGPTVYNLIHIGNARPMIVFDTVRRYMEHKGYEVNYVSNFTDVDDKIIKKAIEEGVEASVISERYIAECRKEKGLTQKALGEKLNVTDRAVSKWETGRSFPDVAILEDLCQELGISVSELLAGKKIEAEHYQEETEKILVSSISKAQMYGYQIALYGLLLAVMLLIYVPVFILKNRLNMGIYMIIAVSVIVFVSMVYLNHKIPGKEFRNSNIWLEGFRGGIVLL